MWFYWISILSFGITSQARELEHCFFGTLLKRNSQISCWVEHKDKDQSTLCIPREIWNKAILNDPERARCFTLQVKPGQDRYQVQEVRPSRNRIFHPFSGLLRRIEIHRERFSSQVSAQDPLGISRRLILAESAHPEAEGILRLMGFVHLLCASGIFLYALSDLMDRVACFFCMRLGWSIRTGRIVHLALNLILWTLAWSLSGFRMGLLRPLVIVGLRKTAQATGVRWRFASPLILALLADLGVEAVLVFGFHHTPAPSGRLHYALAVGGGITAWEMTQNSRSILLRHGAMSVGSWLCVAILDLCLQKEVALATPILSLVTIPLMSWFFYPALLASALHPGLAVISAEISRWLNILISFFLECSIRARSLFVVNPVGIILGFVLAVFFMICPKKWRIGFFCLTLMGSLFVNFQSKLNPQVIQVSVKQGDSALVVTGNRTGLLDTGPLNGKRIREWIEFFTVHGVSALDFVTFTHLDSDHADGFRKIEALIPIRDVILPGDGKPLPFTTFRLKKGTGALIEIQKKGFYLNLGDADWADERRFLKMWAVRAPRRMHLPLILKASHHGSKTGTCPELLKALHPTEIWISVGRWNRYGHPRAETLERIKKAGIPLHRTDLEGDLRF